MKSTTKIVAGVGAFLGAFILANATTDWTALEYLPDALRTQFKGVTIGYDGESGSVVPVSASNPLPVDASGVTLSIDSTGLSTSAKQDTGNTSLANLELYTQCIRPAVATKSATDTATTSTTIDAGCTANALWAQISNLDRSEQIEVDTPDGGSFTLGPLRTSPRICKAGSATPDNFTVTSVDGSSLVSVVAGCAS